MIVDRVLPLDKFTDHLPLLPRVFFVVLMALAAFLGRRYYVILNGAEPHGSEERDEYNNLRQRLKEGGTPTIVYNRWLTAALEKVDKFFGDSGRKDKSWIARAMHLETDGPR